MSSLPAWIVWILPAGGLILWLLCEIILIGVIYHYNLKSIERAWVFFAKSLSLAFIGNVLYSITVGLIDTYVFNTFHNNIGLDTFCYDDLPTFFLILAIFLLVALIVYLLIKFVFFRKTSNCAIILSVLLISAPWIAFIPPIPC